MLKTQGRKLSDQERLQRGAAGTDRDSLGAMRAPEKARKDEVDTNLSRQSQCS